MDVTDSLRKLMMAGVGAASVTAEKSQEILEQLAQKGEEAVGQSKTFNEQLRHRVKEATQSAPAAAEKPAALEDVLAALAGLSPQERRAVQDKLARMNGADATEAKPDAQ